MRSKTLSRGPRPVDEDEEKTGWNYRHMCHVSFADTLDRFIPFLYCVDGRLIYRNET